MRTQFFIFILMITSSVVFSQQLYKELNANDIKQERVKIAKKFAEQFIYKCKNKDLTKFDNLVIDEKTALGFEEILKNKCPEMAKFYGDIKITKLNGAYSYNDTKNVQPAEMYSFDITTSEITNVHFLNVLIYIEKNAIGGLLFSEKKPLDKALK